MIRALAATASLLTLLTAVPAIAQPAKAVPAASAKLAVAPLNYTSRTLANGLKVYAIPDAATANVTVQVWYNVGSKDDPEGRSGFAHLFEHILSRKTRNMPLGTMNKLTEDIGGNRNASTGQDFTNYYELVPAQYLETMLWTHAERMARPVVDEAVFKAEREIVKEELRQRVLSTPYGRLQRFVLADNAFDNHPYRRPGIGSIEQLNSATIEDARAFHEAFYGPDTATLIVAGNFDQAQLDKWVDQYFAAIPKRVHPGPVRKVVIDPPTTKPRTVTAYAPNVPLPAITWTYRIPKLDHPDSAALTVLDTVMATGESSRLYKALVYDKQLASQAATIGGAQEEAGSVGPFLVLASGKKIEDAEAALAVEMARLRDEPITAAELAEARNELIADDLRSRETANGKAFLLGRALTSTGDPTFPDRFTAAIQAVTVADVQRVARKYFPDSAKVAIRYLDESQRPAGEADAWANPVPMPKFASVEPARLPPNELAPEGERQAPPAPAAARPVAPPVIAQKTLANGLKVIAARSSDVPIATLTLVVAGGASVDPANRAGVADMTAGLLTQGTTTRSAPQIASGIEALGAAIGGGAGPDGASLFVSAPAGNLDAAGAILADVALHPAFAAEELERRRKQSLDGLAVALKQPGPLSSLAANRVLYGAAPYGAPASGGVSSLKAMTRDDLVRHHQTWWRPDNTTLIISGGLKEAEAFALAERLFGGWKGEGAKTALPADRSGPAPAPRVVVIDLPGSGQASVVAAQRAVPRADPAYYPLSLGNAILGGGSNGRLFQEVRAKRGLSYGAYSAIASRHDEGLLTASAQTKNESAVEVAKLFVAEIDRIGREPVTAGDLERRKAFLTGAFARQVETSAGVGAVLGGFTLQGVPLAELDRYVPAINAVTVEQVARAVQTETPVSQTSLIIAGDAKLFLEALKGVYPNVEVIPAAALNLDSPTLR